MTTEEVDQLYKVLTNYQLQVSWAPISADFKILTDNMKDLRDNTMNQAHRGIKTLSQDKASIQNSLEKFIDTLTKSFSVKAPLNLYGALGL